MRSDKLSLSFTGRVVKFPETHENISYIRNLRHYDIQSIHWIKRRLHYMIFDYPRERWVPSDLYFTSFHELSEADSMIMPHVNRYTQMVICFNAIGLYIDQADELYPEDILNYIILASKLQQGMYRNRTEAFSREIDESDRPVTFSEDIHVSNYINLEAKNKSLSRLDESAGPCNIDIIDEILKGYPRNEKDRLIQALWERLDDEKKAEIADRYRIRTRERHAITLTYDKETDRIRFFLGNDAGTYEFDLNDSLHYTVLYVLYILDRWSDHYSPGEYNNRLDIGFYETVSNKVHFRYRQIFNDLGEFIYNFKTSDRISDENTDKFLEFMEKQITKATLFKPETVQDIKNKNNNFRSKAYARINRYLYSMFGNDSSCPFIIGNECHLAISHKSIVTDKIVAKIFNCIILRYKYPILVTKYPMIRDMISFNENFSLLDDLTNKNICIPQKDTNWRKIIDENFGPDTERYGSTSPQERPMLPKNQKTISV